MQIDDLKKDSPKGPKRPHSQPLQVLNELSETRTFSLDDVDWAKPLDSSLDWMPERFVSASYLPSFQKLSPEQRRRYNQLNALAVCEQFVWFEEDLLCRVLRNVLKRRDIPSDLRLCLENFIREEERHSEMFRRVLLKAEPEFYSKNKYKFFNITRMQSRFFDYVVANPDQVLVWIWMAIYFEERTLHISKLYRQTEATAGTPKLDATICRIHHLHMIDEARHLQIDQYLLSAFYDPASYWKKQLGAKLTHLVFEAYRAPRRIARRILAQMQAESTNPSDARLFNDLIAELPLLATDRKFKEAMFSTSALGRTRELLAGYPEMGPAYRSLIG